MEEIPDVNLLAAYEDTRNSVQFRSDMTVELVKSSAQDSDVVWAARVSTAGEKSLEELQKDPERSAGLIRYLMRSRHGTPFEHNSMTFFIQAPIFVFREFHRHRIGWSYNEESGRYKELDPVFYQPPDGRALVQTGKPGHYIFEPGNMEQQNVVAMVTRRASEDAYVSYQYMLDDGIAKEVARMVLPLNIYSSMYATCNARSLMSFLSLRVRSSDSRYPSSPQYEIQMVAEQMEDEFAELMPITYRAFVESGRVAP